MNETKHGGDILRTYDFSKSLKSRADLAEKKTFGRRGRRRELVVFRWTLRAVLCCRLSETTKRHQTSYILSVKTLVAQGKNFVLYREQMLALLRCPKPVFDQLAIELPCLMGFRAAEVTTWRAEHIDFAMGDTLVLDAKKHRLYRVPINTIVARHAEKILNGRAEGYVLRSRSNRQPDPNRPLSTTSIWYIWQKWTRLAGLPNARDISPVVGRRFFAAEWYYSQKLSLVTLQKILRHNHFETTMRYVHGLVFYEDVKRDYDRFQLGLMQEIAVPNV